MSEKHRQTVAESWEFLATIDPAAVPGQTSREVPNLETALGSVMLSFDSAGARHVLVPIAAEDEVAPDTRSHGVQLGRSSFIDDGVRRHFVDVSCPDPRLFRLFDLVVASMLEALEARRDESPAMICAEVLASWRALLRRASSPLSASALRGLFGELWVLGELARYSALAVDYWTGPEGQPQDFISARGAFEVKTSGRSPTRRVAITSLDQLDDTGHAAFTLVVVSVLEEPDGLGIPELIEDIVARGVDEDRVLDRVAQVGLQEADFAEASQVRFRVTEHVAYDVRTGFPRLTPESFATPLSQGVVGLRYDIDLAAARDFQLTREEFLRRGQSLVGMEQP